MFRGIQPVTHWAHTEMAVVWNETEDTVCLMYMEDQAESSIRPIPLSVSNIYTALGTTGRLS